MLQPSHKIRTYTHINVCVYIYIYIYSHICICKYTPTPAGAAPRSSVHVCSPLSTTRPLPFLQIAIGPRLPHPFYCSGISPPPPETVPLGSPRYHKPSSAARPFPFEWYFNGSRATRHSSALLGTPRHSSALLGTTNRPRLLHPVYFSGIAMVVE